MFKKAILTILLHTFYNQGYGQHLFGVKGNNFLFFGVGPQVSGIRKEDYVYSNVSPKLRLVYGKRVNEKFDVALGFEGMYFKMILNQDKRYYNYWNLLLSQEIYAIELGAEKKIKFKLSTGGGLLNNIYFNQLGFVGEIGVNLEIVSFNNNRIVIYPNSIMGWDLYQGDNDIINGILLGYSIEF